MSTTLIPPENVSRTISPPITLPTGRVVRYYTLSVHDITLDAQGLLTILDEDEEGELIGFEVACNGSHFIPECKLYENGVNANPFTVNDISFTEMLRRGRGMTPGDAQLAANGQSQDPTGVPSRIFPFITRWKDETLADYLGDETKYFACRYEPPFYAPYKVIRFFMKNTSTTDEGVIKDIIILRRIYLSAADLSQEIASTEDEDEDDAETNEDEATVVDERRTNLDYDYNPQSTTVDEDDVVDEGYIVENDGLG